MYTRNRFRIVTAAALACAAMAAGCAIQPPGAPTSETSGGETSALQGAKNAFKAGNTAAAWRDIKGVSIAALPGERQLAAAELKAEIALASQHPQAALKAVDAAPAAPDPKAQARLLALKGQALFGVGKAARGLELLVERGGLYTSTADVRKNNQLLWSLLSKVSPLPSASGQSKTAQGWIALARIARSSFLEPDALAQRIRKWRARWPDHPANAGLVAQIETRLGGNGEYPVKVALLLPLTGPYAAQAQAVEAGVLAAYYHVKKSHPTLAIYDTHGSVQGVRTAMTKARAGAANFIVGPLTPAGVKAIDSMRPAVPVLALNYLAGDDLAGDSTAAPHFFQFGLSPEQEARSAAERAIAQGLTHALVLAPANGWGSGIANAFAQRLRALGGEVLASAEYQPGAVHFGAQLRSLFNGNLNAPTEGTAAPAIAPSRGAGAQFIFFAAPLETARLIVPQIAYYGGMNLPVYSISDVYQPGTKTDDLDGVNFPIMPWLMASGPVAKLRKHIARLYPKHWRHHAALYALGYDAWRLIPLLGVQTQPLDQPVSGVSGTLSLGPNNIIRRRADWARYVNGKPKLMTAPAPTSAPIPATR
jgi:outer membrane PBP1 activator LpoA protein